MRKSNQQSTKIKPLTVLEESFIAAYISNGGNGAAAVLTAGYKCKAKGAAAVRSSALLIRVNVSSEIAKRRAALRKATDVSAQEVVGVLAAQMRGDPTEAFGDESPFINRLRNKGMGRLVKAVTIKRDLVKMDEFDDELETAVEITRIEFHSSQTAAIQLCKVLGIEQQPGKNKNDPEMLKALLEERVLLGIEGYRRGGVNLTRRDILEMYAMTPETTGDLLPLIHAELGIESSETIQ